MKMSGEPEKFASGRRHREGIEAAQNGLRALGEDYAPPNADDDTSLKIAAAEDQIEHGYTDRGASMLVRRSAPARI